MHRRKVDLPEPEGPMRQNTSPGFTSRSMPLSTSTWPKDLWTPSALTIGTVPCDGESCFLLSFSVMLP